MNRINIAIDGPSGSGKGITAKLLGEKLAYKVLDTGAMYRAVAYFMLINNISVDNFDKSKLDSVKIKFDNDNVILNGKDISEEIRSPAIAKLASDFSTLPEIREFLVREQQLIMSEKGYIGDGRDIGTVVLPDAELKIYLTASILVRARRRLGDYKRKKIEMTLKEVKEQIKERDKQDMEKKVGALKKADDAIVINNSNLSLDEVVDKIAKLVKEKIETLG